MGKPNLKIGMADADFQKKGYFLDASTIDAIASVKEEHGVSKSSAIAVAMQYFIGLPAATRQRLLTKFGAKLRRRAEVEDIAS